MSENKHNPYDYSIIEISQLSDIDLSSLDLSDSNKKEVIIGGEEENVYKVNKTSIEDLRTTILGNQESPLTNVKNLPLNLYRFGTNGEGIINDVESVDEGNYLTSNYNIVDNISDLTNLTSLSGKTFYFVKSKNQAYINDNGVRVYNALNEAISYADERIRHLSPILANGITLSSGFYEFSTNEGIITAATEISGVTVNQQETEEETEEEQQEENYKVYGIKSVTNGIVKEISELSIPSSDDFVTTSDFNQLTATVGTINTNVNNLSTKVNSLSVTELSTNVRVTYGNDVGYWDEVKRSWQQIGSSNPLLSGENGKYNGVVIFDVINCGINMQQSKNQEISVYTSDNLQNNKKYYIGKLVVGIKYPTRFNDISLALYASSHNHLIAPISTNTTTLLLSSNDSLYYGQHLKCTLVTNINSYFDVSSNNESIR